MQEEQRTENNAREISIKVSKCELEFLNFTRSVRYAEFKLVVMNGEPVKAFKPMQSVRFDISKQEGA